MAFKGTCKVASRGSKAWRQRIKVSPKQKVQQGSILVMNTKSVKAGRNTYLGSGNIHAKITGIVEVKDKRISVIAKK